MSGTKVDSEVLPEKWEIFDDMVEAFRQEGIYLYVDLALMNWCRGGWTQAGWRDMRLKAYFDMDNALGIWTKGVTALLNHKSRYTGIALKDEPAVACILFWNEQDNTLNPWGGFRQNSATRKILEQQFQEFIKKKYGTVEAVRKAWNNPKLRSFESIEFKGITAAVKNPEMKNDMVLYYYSIQKKLQDYFVAFIKKSGYKGLYTYWDSSKSRKETILRNELPLVSTHDYAAHPFGNTVAQKSNAESGCGYFASMNQTRILGIPMSITEYGQAFWNQYGHEAGILVPAYASFQNYAFIMVHSDAVGLKATEAMEPFVNYSNPIFRANEFISAHLFRRGDVTPANKWIEVRIRPSETFRNGHANDAVNAAQAKLAFVCGLGITISESTDPNPHFDWMLKDIQGTKITGTEYTNTMTEDNRTAFYFDRTIRDLKTKGILPKDNPTSYEAGIYQNLNDELRLERKKKMFRVITSKTEAVTMPAGNTSLRHMESVSTSEPAAIAVIPVDNQPIPKSSRMVLVYSTDTVNNGMQLSHSRERCFQKGTRPALLKTGTLKLTLNQNKKMKLYALAFDGTPLEEIPVIQKNGKLQISINTAELNCTATPFFELTTGLSESMRRAYEKNRSRKTPDANQKKTEIKIPEIVKYRFASESDVTLESKNAKGNIITKWIKLEKGKCYLISADISLKNIKGLKDVKFGCMFSTKQGRKWSWAYFSTEDTDWIPVDLVLKTETNDICLMYGIPKGGTGVMKIRNIIVSELKVKPK